MSEGKQKKEITEDNIDRLEEHIEHQSDDEIIEKLIKDETEHAGTKEHEKKLKKLKKTIAKVEEERDAFKDSYQRTFSEFNNFKKRNLTASSIAMKDGMGDAVAKILPVLDSIERALEHVDEQEDNAFVQGVSMVYKQLTDILAGMEVSEIPAMGEPFDPNVHQAIQQVEAEEGVAPETVVAVVQKGYKMCDKILRHSMVIVSK